MLSAYMIQSVRIYPRPEVAWKSQRVYCEGIVLSMLSDHQIAELNLSSRLFASFANVLYVYILAFDAV